MTGIKLATRPPRPAHISVILDPERLRAECSVDGRKPTVLQHRNYLTAVGCWLAERGVDPGHAVFVQTRGRDEVLRAVDIGGVGMTLAKAQPETARKLMKEATVDAP